MNFKLYLINIFIEENHTDYMYFKTELNQSLDKRKTRQIILHLLEIIAE